MDGPAVDGAGATADMSVCVGLLAKWAADDEFARRPGEAEHALTRATDPGRIRIGFNQRTPQGACAVRRLVLERAARQRLAAVGAAGVPRSAALAVAALVRADAAFANLFFPDGLAVKANISSVEA